MEISTENDMRQWVVDNAFEDDEEEGPLLAEGFDEAIIGLWGNIVVYDRDICIDILLDEILEEAQIAVAETGDGELGDRTVDDAYVEAVEYFEYNVLDAYVGENTPIFIITPNFTQDDNEDS